jgi:hypothetical protein
LWKSTKIFAIYNLLGELYITVSHTPNYTITHTRPVLVSATAIFHCNRLTGELLITHSLVGLLGTTFGDGHSKTNSATVTLQLTRRLVLYNSAAVTVQLTGNCCAVPLYIRSGACCGPRQSRKRFRVAVSSPRVARCALHSSQGAGTRLTSAPLGSLRLRSWRHRGEVGGVMTRLLRERFVSATCRSGGRGQHVTILIDFNQLLRDFMII